MARRRRAEREAWKTFTVTVREVRGSAGIYAAVRLSSVTGVPGTPHNPLTVWEGVVAHREPGESMSPEQAARYARAALGEAYPPLF